jgi:NAD(P)-dependent dehydrogenase (short-subunit alcohol dehydrogenase family)
MRNIRPEVVVIAGAGPGLAASLARRFGAENCRVGLLARSADYLETLSEELRAAGVNVVTQEADVSVLSEVQAAFKKFRQQIGPVDVLINHASAGGPFGQSILELDCAIFEQGWRAAALGGLFCSKEVLPTMIERGRGSIIFTGATSSLRGSAIAFSSAKFAVRGLAQAMARELWPKGIHVAHVVVDGVIGSETDEFDTLTEPLMNPSAMAETYWQLALQDRTAWTLELDLRANREAFFE